MTADNTMKMQINSKLIKKKKKKKTGILQTLLKSTEDPNNHQYEGTRDQYQLLTKSPLLFHSFGVE